MIVLPNGRKKDGKRRSFCVVIDENGVFLWARIDSDTFFLLEGRGYCAASVVSKDQFYTLVSIEDDLCQRLTFFLLLETDQFRQ